MESKLALGISIAALGVACYTFVEVRSFANSNHVLLKEIRSPYDRPEVINRTVIPGIAPCSCAEWWTMDIPVEPYVPSEVADEKCKVVGGTNYCGRARGAQSGSLDIGPVEGQTRVNTAIFVHFRLRGMGSGDAIVYNFGKIDWGDNQQQAIAGGAFNQDVVVGHVYTAAKLYVVHADAGAQFKYQPGNSPGGPSGSYEACQDNSININVTP